MLTHLVFVAGTALAASVAPEWLTITGDPLNDQVNTIQVDPAPMEMRGAVKVLRVRVSRSATRTSSDGVQYRSFESLVGFDCARRTARYRQIRFFMDATWKGEPYRILEYTDGEPRWMQFREVEPNPNQRIINAACSSGMEVR
jgi:hypothetical protein